MTVIDLGELGDDVVPDTAPRPPRAVGRPFRVVVALLVALVTLAAAAPPARSVVGTIPGGTGATAFLADDRVYVVPRTAPGPGREVVAYREGRQRWRGRVDGVGDVVGVWEQGGRVLAVGPAGDGDRWATVAFDAGTGALRWRQAGVAFPAGDGLLLRPVGGPDAQPVRRLSVADGRTLWTVPTTGRDVQFSYGPSGVDRILLLPAAGETEVWDAATGARLAARDLHPTASPGARATQGVGGLLLETRLAGGVVTAYELDTLRPRWTADLPLVGYLERCGALLCAGRPNGGMWALDPATGVVRWASDLWSSVLRADGGRLLVSVGRDGGEGLSVLDGTDGRLIAEVGDWNVLPQGESGDRLFLTRPLGGGRMLLAEPDLSGGPPVVRDVVTGTDCTAGRVLLVCRERNGDFAVRRLP
ncbi:PQQ-binding-like beta-propeller repeat protein [Micromonospora schwarzwaldensis]|uniref:outer membrane protein assembly factor BamB family protein n=1 Tax=Micromonospora sp. DSM 45708 TaxID=3111767 RepID=UPI0031D6747B